MEGRVDSCNARESRDSCELCVNPRDDFEKDRSWENVLWNVNDEEVSSGIVI